VLFHGHVAGVSPGTGAAFALLPAQNASGNWIKVIQRVPVRIELDPQELARHPLRIGLSADVDVDTRDQSGTMLATSPASSAVSDTSVYAGDLAAAQSQADTIIRASLERR
jgi:membrane fusion protein (multidrug efflux system)